MNGKSMPSDSPIRREMVDEVLTATMVVLDPLITELADIGDQNSVRDPVHLRSEVIRALEQVKQEVIGRRGLSTPPRSSTTGPEKPIPARPKKEESLRTEKKDQEKDKIHLRKKKNS